jgi:hypothetical protein
LTDAELRTRCGEAIRRRTERYYNKTTVDQLYRNLYQEHLALPDRSTLRKAA